MTTASGTAPMSMPTPPAPDSWLNGTYKNLLDADIRGVIGTTKIKYTPGNGNNTVGTLQRAIFLLSDTELNRSASWFNVEGTALEIASSLQIAYMNGSAVVQWTRSPGTDSSYYAVCLYAQWQCLQRQLHLHLRVPPRFHSPLHPLCER